MTTQRLVLIVLLVLAGSVLPVSADWQPAPGPLMTRWAKDVSPDNVWPEYPRPQMVRAQWTNLNGLWDYGITSKDAGQPEQWDGKILVPFCAESALSGVMKRVQPDQALWYRRTFKVPDLAGDKRLLLHFGAVDWHATCWLNGEKIGEHKGGYAPFRFDITDHLGKEQNELVVRVWDPTDQGFQPRGKQVLNPRGIYYTSVTGIWQTVWLEAVPSGYVESLKITPDLDAGQVSVTASVAGADSTAEIRVAVQDGGKTVAEATGRAGQSIALKLKGIKSWSPDQPHLYDLRISYGDDEVSSYFAMRKIEVDPDSAGVNRLFLNNEPLFQYGPLDQGWWPDGLYTPPSDAALKYDIEVTKKLGMNMARKHVKVEHPRFYYWADRMGLLVWQDMPSGNFGKGGDEGRANFERELRAMVRAFGNHPSIVMWVPFNEGWGQHDTPRYVDLLRELDPTRPVNNASGWHDRGVGDVRDVHKYPGPASAPLEDSRAIVLGEFGGLGLKVDGHLWKQDKNWGYRSFNNVKELNDAYVGLLQKLRPLIADGLAAAVYTQTSDVEIEINGLMTYDREILKLDVTRAAEAAAKLYLPPPRVEPIVPTSRIRPQSWSFTTTQPADGWQQPGFDDSAWKTGPGGFGVEKTPGAVARTEWTSSDIWIRRSFTLDAVPDDVLLQIHHDEDAEVYLNGVLAASLNRFTTAYVITPISEAAAQALKKGSNTIAIHCKQTTGDQYIDAGLLNMAGQ